MCHFISATMKLAPAVRYIITEFIWSRNNVTLLQKNGLTWWDDDCVYNRHYQPHSEFILKGLKSFSVPYLHIKYPMCSTQKQSYLNSITMQRIYQKCKPQRWKYLASSSASVVPSHNVLVVLILFGQVVKEHTLCHRLKHETNVISYALKKGNDTKTKEWRGRKKSIPFSLEKTQSDWSFWGAGWTCGSITKATEWIQNNGNFWKVTKYHEESAWGWDDISDHTERKWEFMTQLT